jgi:hypothetical protein
MPNDMNDSDVRVFFRRMAEEAPHEPPVFPPNTAARVRRRFVLNAVVLGLALALVAYSGIVAYRALGGTQGSQPATSPTGAVGGTMGSPTASPPQTGWVEVHPDYSTDPVDLRAVAADDGVFVAVGDTSLADGVDPVWFSADGRTWTRAPQATAPDSLSLWDVIADGPGFVAVGVDHGGDPAAWTSSDGQAWEKSSVDLPTDIGNVDSIFGVVRTTDGMLAWGRVHGNDAYVWASQDGHSWESIQDESVFGGEGDQSIAWIVETADGFTAGGSERPRRSTAAGDPVEWTSSDGVTWTRAQADVTEMGIDEWWSLHYTDQMTATNSYGTVRLVEFDASNSTIIRFRPAEP